MAEGNFVIYRSSAGSGKTYTLVKEYLRLVLLSEVPLPFRHVLAITFTNKAANEMKERVIESLTKLSAPQDDFSFDPDYLADIATFTKLSEEEVATRASRILREMLHNYADLAISTIDKFVHRVVRAFAHDLHLPLDFEVELDSDSILTTAIDLLIAQVGSDQELTQTLVDFTEQKVADDRSWHVEQDLFNFAKNLLKEDSRPFLDRLESYSIEDFVEIREQIKTEIERQEAIIRGYGEQAIQLIEEAGVSPAAFAGGKRSGLPKYFEYLSTLNYKKFEPSKTLLKSLEADKWYAGAAKAAEKAAIDEIKTQLFELYSKAQSWIKNELGNYHFFRLVYKHLFSLSLVNELDKMIQEIKQDGKLLFIQDFNQIISMVVMNEPAPFIYEQLGERYTNYLIDEFQDTSILQWQNLLPLVENSLATGNMNLLVGDGKQAIYRWRGGEVEQFAKLPEIHQPPAGHVLAGRQRMIRENFAERVLDTNYRSSEAVVSFNNVFFETLTKRLNEDYAGIYEQHAQAFLNHKPDGYVQVKVLPDAYGAEQEELFLKDTKRCIDEALEDGFSLKDIAILVRSNSKGSLVASYLIEQGIPVVSSESLLLSAAPEVSFLLEFFRLIQQPREHNPKVAIIRYICTHLYPEIVFTDALEKHCIYNEKHYLKRVDLQGFLAELGYTIKLSYFIQQPIYEVAETLIRTFNLNAGNAYIQFFLDAVHQFSQKQGNNIVEFLEWWEEKKHKLSVVVPSGIDAVQIMTIHKSKGLQFPIVIMPFVNWNIGPSQNNLWLPLNEEVPGLDVALVPTEKTIESTAYAPLYTEEVNKSLLDDFNLLYVAFTRPEIRLYALTNLVSRANSIGNPIYETLLMLDGWQVIEEAYINGTRSTSPLLPEAATDTEFINQLISTPWTEKLSISYQSATVWNEKSNDGMGALIHTALSRIHTRDEIENTVEAMENEGLLSHKETGALSQALSTLLAPEAFDPFFDATAQIKTNQEILTPSGELVTPDRVVINGAHARVMLYKFGTPHPEHRTEGNTFVSLLESMQYHPVTCFLFYTQTGQLLEIT